MFHIGNRLMNFMDQFRFSFWKLTQKPLKPVSYTHLDVYKRQGILTPLMSGREISRSDSVSGLEKSQKSGITIEGRLYSVSELSSAVLWEDCPCGLDMGWEEEGEELTVGWEEEGAWEDGSGWGSGLGSGSGSGLGSGSGEGSGCWLELPPMVVVAVVESPPRMVSADAGKAIENRTANTRKKAHILLKMSLIHIW